MSLEYSHKGTVCGQTGDDNDKVDLKNRVESLMLAYGLNGADNIHHNTDNRNGEYNRQASFLRLVHVQVLDHPPRESHD